MVGIVSVVKFNNLIRNSIFYKKSFLKFFSFLFNILSICSNFLVEHDIE